MRLRITRSGGFINAPSSVEIDTATAAPSVGRKAQDFVAALAQHEGTPQANLPDDYVYTVSFSDVDPQNETPIPARSDAAQLAADLYQGAAS